jgi:Flp pilus assembly protein TadD
MESSPESPPPEERETAYDLLQRGEELLQRRHHAQAAIVLERADRLEPHRQSILEALGRAYFNSGQHERSRQTFSELLELDPSAHYAHYALGQSLKRLGRPSEARTHLKLAVALSPGTPLYRQALARMPKPEPDSSD